MSKILIIEDEMTIAELEKDYLELSGFRVEIETNGERGLRRVLEEDYNMVILDLMLPGMDGFEVCRQIREHKNLPILMVSAKKDDIDKIRGLGLGADDYVTKPFSPAELTARVDALYRRTGGTIMQDADEISQPPFLLNTRNRTLEKDGKRVKLTKVEYAIVKLFMENPGKALSREEILETVWGREYLGELKIVDVNIRRLRIKLEDDPQNPAFVITVWGHGYKWDA